MIVITRYGSEEKQLWDDFISRSKNGLFLFKRDYMDYHADRFIDHSLMFYQGEKLVGIMPASLERKELISHGGLTFGGIVSDKSMKTALMVSIFESLMKYLQSTGIERLIYKAIPHIYHSIPAEEDLYALFIHGARLIRRDVSSTRMMRAPVRYSKGRKHALKKALKSELQIRRSEDWAEFMEIEAYVLATYHKTSPVHTADEIQMLAERFPENIKLFAAYQKSEMLAGVVVYESRNVAHAQYIAGSDKGKAVGAVDLVIDYLINDYYSEKRLFDFGISTTNNGRDLNQGLTANKESFGARTTVYDFYALRIH